MQAFLLPLLGSSPVSPPPYDFPPLANVARSMGSLIIHTELGCAYCPHGLRDPRPGPRKRLHFIPKQKTFERSFMDTKQNLQHSCLQKKTLCQTHSIVVWAKVFQRKEVF